MFNTISKIAILGLVAASLSGCLLAAVGAGAAGGIYTKDHYKIVKKKKHS